MKKLLRLVSVLLVVALTCTTLAVTSFADGNVAAVTIDGVTTEYATLKEAFAVLTSSTTATIDLLCDTSYSGSAALQFNGNVTLDLNGHTITGTSSGSVFGIKASSTVTICNGTITGKSNSGVVAVNNKNTVVTLENLTLSNTSTSSSSLYAYSALQMTHSVSTTVTATNCTFTSASSAGSAISYSTSSSSRSLSQTVTLNNCVLSAPKYGLKLYGGHSSSHSFNITLNDCTVTTTGSNSTAVYVQGQSKSYYARFALTINDADITSTNLLSNENTYINTSSTVTVSGNSTLNVSSLDGKTALDYITLTVTGGNSSVDVEEYVDTTANPNLQYVETESGTYVAGYSATLECEAEEGDAEEAGTVEGVESVIAPDSVVTFTVTCEIGYQVSKVAVYTSVGMSEVTVIDNQDGTYSFTMPAGSVSISVSYYQFSAEVSGIIYVDSEHHGMFINGHLATYPHTVDENGYCTVCKEYIGVETTGNDTAIAEADTAEIIEDEVNIEALVEDSNTEPEPDDEPEELEVSETETNPTTGAVLMLLPMAVAAAGAVAGKRR